MRRSKISHRASKENFGLEDDSHKFSPAVPPKQVKERRSGPKGSQDKLSKGAASGNTPSASSGKEDDSELDDSSSKKRHKGDRSELDNVLQHRRSYEEKIENTRTGGEPSPEVIHLREKLRRQKAAHSHFRTMCEDNEKKMAADEKWIERLENRLGTAEHNLKILKDRYKNERDQANLDRKERESAYDELEKKFKKSEAQIGELQRKELAILRSSALLEDGVARDNLKDAFHDKIKAISRPLFSKIPRESILNNKNLNLQEILSKVFMLRWFRGQWEIDVRDNPDLRIQVFIDALLSTSITDKFFKNPFFRFEGNPQYKEALVQLYLEAYKKDPKTAESWKAKTIELAKIMTPSENPTAYPQYVGSSTPAMQSQLDKISSDISGCLSDLLQGHKPVSESEDKKLREKVTDLVRSSAALADDWHSRDFTLHIIDLFWLETHGIDWESESASKYVEFIPKTKILMKEKRYRIMAVISPGFIRHEHNAGVDGYTEVVWEKAQVLLEETWRCLI